MRDFIPVCEPVMDGREREYLISAIDSGWVSSAGHYLEEFESKWAAYCGAKHGVACSSGTAGLHLAFRALGLGAGDEVIMPSATIVATSNMALLTRCRPVFVDADPETWCLDPGTIEARITSRTRAILAAHMFGHPCDMDAIGAIARRHGLKVIEDASQAHGARFRGRPVGALGDISVFSFYANKLLMTGEGGMVVTNDDALAARTRLLRNQAFTQPRFQHWEIGYNYRLSNLQAAIGLAQCERIEEKVAAKIRIAHWYSERLADIRGLSLPVCRPWARNVYWMYGVVLDATRPRAAEIMAALERERIETRAFFYPLHRQPAYESLGPDEIDKEAICPVSDHLGERGFYLPSGLNLTESEVDRVAGALRRILES